jgi:hypothetical protein
MPELEAAYTREATPPAAEAPPPPTASSTRRPPRTPRASMPTCCPLA